MPRRYHLQSGKVVISIAKFFYYLAIYDTCTGGKWKGTKSDSAQFAKIKTSEFYKDTINYKNLRKFMDICLANFEERDTTYTYPPKYINLYENNKPDNMMDDSVITKSYTVMLSDKGKENLNTETLRELRDGRFMTKEISFIWKFLLRMFLIRNSNFLYHVVILSFFIVVAIIDKDRISF
jgi:hypothetical protein